jgi:hypothetical protein
MKVLLTAACERHPSFSNLTSELALELQNQGAELTTLLDFTKYDTNKWYDDPQQGTRSTIHLPNFEDFDILIHNKQLFNQWQSCEFNSDCEEWQTSPNNQKSLIRRSIHRKIKARLSQQLGKKVVIANDTFMTNSLETFGIPQINTPKTISKQEWELNPTYPIVLKNKHSSCGMGVFYIQSKDDYEGKFQEDLHNIRMKLMFVTGKGMADNFDAQEYIACPHPEYNTHYRIFTAGSAILGAALHYAKKSNPSERKLENICSNVAQGGKQIILTPGPNTPEPTMEEKNILGYHWLESPKIPSYIETLAKQLGAKYSEKGAYFLGQDWIQSRDGNFYLLESNLGPACALFENIEGLQIDPNDKDGVRANKLGAKSLASQILKQYRN